MNINAEAGSEEIRRPAVNSAEEKVIIWLDSCFLVILMFFNCLVVNKPPVGL